MSAHPESSPDEYGFTRRKTDYWPKEDIASLPAHLRPDKGETLDLILRQKIYLLQSRRGYRANTDSHVLAYFASQCVSSCATHPLRVLELGAGVGLVSVLFAKANDTSEVHLLELQGQLASRARRNLELNDVKGFVTRHDLKGGNLPEALCGQFDAVLINPPFYPLGERRPPKLREKFLAHMETSASFSDFLYAAFSALDERSPYSFVAVIHDVRELPRLQVAVEENHFEVCQSREMIHFAGEPATRTLLQLKPRRESDRSMPVEEQDGRRYSQIPSLPPLVLHAGPNVRNKYCDEIENFLAKLPRASLRIGRLKEDVAM